MVLVDPIQWKAAQKTSHPIPDGLSTSIENLDRDMNSILHDDGEDVYTKAKTYQQTLHRYLNLADRYRDKPLGKIEMSNNNIVKGLARDTLNDPVRDLKSKILETIPKKLQPKASSLIEHLKDLPGIKWDQKLQLVVGDKTIEGSNAVDLIHDLIRNRKTAPHGWEDLATALKRTNIPREFIGNQSRLQWMERGRPERRKPSSSDRRLQSKNTFQWEHVQ